MTILHVNIEPGKPQLPAVFSFRALEFVHVEALARLLKVTTVHPMQLTVLRVPHAGKVVLVELHTCAAATQATLCNTMGMLPGGQAMQESLRSAPLFADLLKRAA